MATSLTSKGLIAVADKSIIAARPALDMVKLFVTDFKPKAAKKYQTLDINVLKGAVADFAAGSNNYTTGTNGEVNFARVALEKDVISKFAFNDKDFLEDEFNPEWATLGPAFGRKISTAFVQYMMGKLTYDKIDESGAKTLAASVAAATFEDFQNLWKECNDAGYDPESSVLVLTPAAYLRLKNVADYKTTGVSAIDIARSLGSILGFKAVVNAPNCSTVSGAKVSGVAPTKGVGFIVPENALALVNREKKAAKDGGNLLEYGTTVDEETGIVISTRVVANTDDGEYVWSQEALYGAALTKQTLTIGEQSIANGAPGILQIVTE